MQINLSRESTDIIIRSLSAMLSRHSLYDKFHSYGDVAHTLEMMEDLRRADHD